MQHDERHIPEPAPRPGPDTGPTVAGPAAVTPDGTSPGVTGRIDRFARRVHPVTWPLGLGALAIAGMVLLHFVDPNEPGNYPTCPWFALTGTFCPGCGTMRATALLTHMDVLGAVSMNPLLFLLIPYLVYVYVSWLIGTLRPRTRLRARTPLWFVWSLLAAFLVFWIARNLPWFAFLAPGTPLFPGW